MPKRRRSTTYGNKPKKQLQEQQTNQASVKSLSKAKCKQSQIKHSSITENKKNVKYIKVRSNENVKFQIFNKNKIKTKLEKQEPSVAKEQRCSFYDQKPCTSNKCLCKMEFSEKRKNTMNVCAEKSANNILIINKKSKSEVLDTVPRINKRITNIHKSSTIWTKFPLNYVKTCTSKAPAPNLTSVYQPGTSYSDVLFSAGPSCSVKIKTMASDSIIETNLPFPPLRSVKPLEIKVPRNEGDAICIDKQKSKTALKSYSPEVLVPKRSHEEVLAITTNESMHMINIDKKSCSGNDNNGLVEETISKAEILETKLVNYNENLNKSLESTLKPVNSKKFKTLTEQEDPKSKKSAEVMTCNVCQELEYLKNNLKLLTSESLSSKTNVLKLDIPLWNFTELDEGPEIYPRYSKQFNDEIYLMAEDMANLGFKLSRGN